MRFFQASLKCWVGVFVGTSLREAFSSTSSQLFRVFRHSRRESIACGDELSRGGIHTGGDVTLLLHLLQYLLQ